MILFADDCKNNPVGKVSEEKILLLFQKKISSTPDRQRRIFILSCCARLDRPWVERLLWKALEDYSELVRDSAVKQLINREKINDGLLLEALASCPWYVRCAALKVMGKRKMSQLVARLKPLLQDNNVEVRRTLAETLGEIGGDKALPLLVRLRQDKNNYVKTAAEIAMARVSSIRFT